jgi:hypothetical protein
MVIVFYIWDYCNYFLVQQQPSLFSLLPYMQLSNYYFPNNMLVALCLLITLSFNSLAQLTFSQVVALLYTSSLLFAYISYAAVNCIMAHYSRIYTILSQLHAFAYIAQSIVLGSSPNLLYFLICCQIITWFSFHLFMLQELHIPDSHRKWFQSKINQWEIVTENWEQKEEKSKSSIFFLSVSQAESRAVPEFSPCFPVQSVYSPSPGLKFYWEFCILGCGISLQP